MENEEIMETFDEGLVNTEPIGENDGSSSIDTITDNAAQYDSSDSQSDISNEPTLEELLKEYFSGSKEQRSLDPEEDGINSVESSREVSSEEVIDYTQILNDLYDEATYQSSMQETALQYYEDYQSNNTLSSAVDSISLTNIALLYLGGCILALLCVNFARRIF